MKAENVTKQMQASLSVDLGDTKMVTIQIFTFSFYDNQKPLHNIKLLCLKLKKGYSMHKVFGLNLVAVIVQPQKNRL